MGQQLGLWRDSLRLEGVCPDLMTALVSLCSSLHNAAHAGNNFWMHLIPQACLIVFLSLKAVPSTASLPWWSFPYKPGRAFIFLSPPQALLPSGGAGRLEVRAGVQGWILLCCGEEEQNWDTRVKQRSQRHCCWQHMTAPCMWQPFSWQ